MVVGQGATIWRFFTYYEKAVTSAPVLKVKTMKNRLVSVMLLLSTAAFGQATVRDQFQKIGTVQAAQAWVDANAALKPALLNLASGKDSTVIDKRLLRQDKGDIFSVGYVTYKVIDAT
jgi:hypothetical protein